MIFDSHYHLLDRGWVHDDYLSGIARIVAAGSVLQTGESPPDPELIVRNALPVLADPTGEKRVAAMDSMEIDASAIFCLDFAAITGEPGVPIEDQNRMIAEAGRRYRDRLIPFFSIDPRRHSSLEMFQRGVEDWGMRGLKLHPAAGFYPYDEACYPLYEACVEYGVPVIIHAGSQPAPMKFRYARPVYVDDVAADFPDLKIVIAHVGHSWWEETLLVAGVKPNVCVDFSGWQFMFNERPDLFYRMLRLTVDALGPWRVFYGTDGPFLDGLVPQDRWIKAIREPDLSSSPDASFLANEKDIMLGKGFAKLLSS